MPANGIRKIKLKDVCDRITVGHVGPMADEYTSDGIPFLRSQNITPFRLHLEDVKFVSPHFHDKLRKSALRPGDVAVVRTGYPGTACVVPDAFSEWNCADLVVVTPSKELNPYYLASIFNSAWGMASVAGNLVGVAQQHFNVGAARELEILLPSRVVQDRIAGILSAYDDLIENNLRRIKILEEMARLLYREWFVHFRFPGHEKVRFVDSPLGNIPEGWEVKYLPECIDINPRIGVSRDSKKPFVPMGCLSNDLMLITNIESRDGNSGAKFQNGDTLFARITPCLENGKTGFVQFLPNAEAVACGSTEFIVLRSRTLSPEFVYCLARSDEFRGNAIKSMSGATGRQRVQEHCFDGFQIARPPDALLGRFSAIVTPSFHLIHALHLQIQNLRETRDMLLPRLLAGETELRNVNTESVEVEANDRVEIENSVDVFKSELAPKDQNRHGSSRLEIVSPIDQADRAEVLAAIRQIFSDGFSGDRENAIRAIARELGYHRAGHRIQQILDDDLRTAVRRGILDNTNGELRLLARSITDYDRDFLKKQFLAAIERRWIQRDEAIQTFARWLGFSRRGPVIDETARSLINGLIREGRLEADGPELIRRTG